MSGDPESKSEPDAPVESAPAAAQDAEPQSAPEPQALAVADDDNNNILDQARRFLSTDEVKNSSREKKASFLKSKGLPDGDVEKLLSEEQQQQLQLQLQPQQEPSSSSPALSPNATTTKFSPAQTTIPAYSAPPAPPQPPTASTSMPPIITYPEFLATPPQPTASPLITISHLTSILYASALAGATLYGTGKFLVNPMLQTQTAARESLAEGTNAKLAQLVDKLEGVVSVVPPRPASASTPASGRKHGKKRAAAAGTVAKYKSRGTGKGGVGESDGDADSEAEEEFYESSASDDDSRDTDSDASDPTELFHRDIGTQTTDPLPATPAAGISPSSSSLLSSSIPKKPSEAQNDKLTKLTSRMREICQGLVGQREDAEQIGTVVGLLREDLDKMTYPSPYGGGGGVGAGSSSSYGIYGGGYSNLSSREPDDEIKKSRDEIRRLKGVLLSARTFPASTR